jgi:hypothetical protein
VAVERVSGGCDPSTMMNQIIGLCAQNRDPYY